jgi:phosphate transport system protein
MTARRHPDRSYDQQLGSLRAHLLLMGAKVEDMVQAGMRALVERDSLLAKRTIAADKAINRLEIETDEMCVRILVRRQPVASDLRLITLALKLVVDLERIGDLAASLCDRVIELNDEPPLKTSYGSLQLMAEAVQGMLREALDAFVKGDAERAVALRERDQMVDDQYNQMFRELLTYMMEDPRNIFRATRLQSIAKYLERIGDHATNLAEMVVFMVRGKDIRHPASMVAPLGGMS